MATKQRYKPADPVGAPTCSRLNVPPKAQSRLETGAPVLRSMGSGNSLTASGLTRRDLIKRCAILAGGAVLGSSALGAVPGGKAGWLEMLEDPARKLLPGKPDLDKVLALFPRTTGQPAFDPGVIAANIAKLRTTPAINTGHPFLDLSVKTGLAHIDATFRGDHPKYGVGVYAKDAHDGFPPTIIAAVDALSAWGLNRRAAREAQYVESLPNHPHRVQALTGVAAVRDFAPVTIPADHCFMLGDNRDNSFDSRFYGTVKRDRIIGRSRSVVLSFKEGNWLRPRWERWFSSLD